MKVRNVKHKTFRVEDKLAEQIENDVKAKPQFASENQWLTEASEHFLKCQKAPTPEGPKLMRAPIDLKCANEHCEDREILFGAYCYYHATTGALCLNCGVKRGWVTKDRIKKLLEEMDLKLSVSELKRQVKTEILELKDLKEQRSIYELGARQPELEEEKNQLVQIALKFMREKVGTPEQEKALQQILDQVAEVEALQKKVQEEVADRLKVFERKKKRKKKTKPQEEEEEPEQVVA